MQLYGNPTGRIVRIVRDDGSLTAAQEPETTNTFELDESTNAVLARDILEHPNEYTLLAGVLLKGSDRVTVTAPSTAYQDRKAVTALLAKLEANANLTQAELRQALRASLRHVR